MVCKGSHTAYAALPLKCILTEDEIKMIEQKIENEIDEAVEYAKSLPDIEPEEALKDVFAGGGF